MVLELAEALPRRGRLLLRIAFGPNVGKELLLRVAGREVRHRIEPSAQVVTATLESVA